MLNINDVNDHDTILKFFSFIWDESEEEHSKVRGEWDRNFMLYNDTYQFTDKQDWQTKVQDPITNSLVTKAANFFTRILINEDPKYLDVRNKNKMVADGTRTLVLYDFESNDYAQLFNEGLKLSFLTSPMVHKVEYLVSDETFPIQKEVDGETVFDTDKVSKGRVVISNVDPYNIRLDPNPGTDMYIIEVDADMDLYEYLELAENNNYEFSESILADSLTDLENEGSHRPTVKVCYVCARAVTDGAGNLKDRDVKFIVVNDQYVVSYEKNLLPKGMFPYTVGFPMKTVGDKYGRGYISVLCSVIINYLEVLNLLKDGFHLDTLGIYEVLKDGIDPDADAPALEPGKMITVTQKETIKRIFNNEANPNNDRFLATFDRLIQNRSGQNEFFQGQPTQRGRPTAEEINTKTSDTANHFADVGNEIERNVLEPLAELVTATHFLYLNQEDHIEIEDSVQDKKSFLAIKGMGFNERMKHVIESRFVVRGISGKINKLNNFGKLERIFATLGNLPIADLPALAKRLDDDKLLDVIFDFLDEPVSLLFDGAESEQNDISLDGNPAVPTAQGEQAQLKQLQQGLDSAAVGGGGQ